MVLKQEELLSKYFDHRMTADEEQNFLIQLAASDDLRTAFRSHLELQKAIRDDKDDLRSVAQVRNRTLTALGLSAAAVTPFIEQELMKSSVAAEREPLAASVAPRIPFMTKVGSVLRSRLALLSTGLILGFAAASAIFSTNSTPVSVPHSTVSPVSGPVATPSPNVSTETVNPSVIEPSSGSQAPETIHSTNGLNTKPQSITSSRTTSPTGSTTEAAPSTRSTPTVSVTRPGHISVKAAKVTKSDTTNRE